MHVRLPKYWRLAHHLHRWTSNVCIRFGGGVEVGRVKGKQKQYSGDMG